MGDGNRTHTCEETRFCIARVYQFRQHLGGLSPICRPLIVALAPRVEPTKMGERALHVAIREIDPQNKQRTSRGYRCLVESRINGKRIRKYSKRVEKSEAVRYREELFRQANEVRKQDRQLIAGNLLHEAVTAHRALSPFSKTITDAVTFYSEHLIASTKQSKAPLTDAIENFFTPKK